VRSNSAGAAYIAMDGSAPAWQSGPGWYEPEEGFRWTAPEASATLDPPAGARQFELVVQISPDQLRRTGLLTIAVSLDGTGIGRREFREAGKQISLWPVREAGAGLVKAGIRVSPEYRPDGARRLGAAVVGLGFR
jgi:hypothetical protein